MGYVHGIEYREAAVYLDNGRATSTDVFRIHFRTHEDEMDHHDFPNSAWSLGNAGLQFMALYGYRPTDFPENRTLLNTDDSGVLIGLAPDPHSNGWGLSQTAMRGGKAALDEAEWFDPDVGDEAADEAHNGPQAPPGPDPGGGSTGAVEMEVSEEDEDTGVTFVVE